MDTAEPEVTRANKARIWRRLRTGLDHQIHQPRIWAGGILFASAVYIFWDWFGGLAEGKTLGGALFAFLDDLGLLMLSPAIQIAMMALAIYLLYSGGHKSVERASLEAEATRADTALGAKAVNDVLVKYERIVADFRKYLLFERKLAACNGIIAKISQARVTGLDRAKDVPSEHARDDPEFRPLDGISRPLGVWWWELKECADQIGISEAEINRAIDVSEEDLSAHYPSDVDQIPNVNAKKRYAKLHLQSVRTERILPARVQELKEEPSQIERRQAN